jgi:dephospho-CoA kinase
MIIGLTGGIGSGKSTAAQFFRELGISVIDADQLTRQLVAPNQPSLEKIVQHFGPTILQQDGTLNRAELRSIVFESPKERLWLENLLHPLVKKLILQQAELVSSEKYQIVEIPLLFEANFQDAVDRVLVIDAPDEIQKERVSLRDAIPKEAIQTIIDSQIARRERLARADDIIENMGSQEDLKKKVETLHYYYIKLSS